MLSNLQEDPWNAILSGAATGGLLAIRGKVYPPYLLHSGFPSSVYTSIHYLRSSSSDLTPSKCLSLYIFFPPITAGPKAAGKNAVIGGLVLAMIEGASIAITKVRLDGTLVLASATTHSLSPFLYYLSGSYPMPPIYIVLCTTGLNSRDGPSHAR